MKLRKEPLLKNIVSAVILAIGIGIYYRSLTGVFALLDGIFLSGVLFLCIGLWKLVRRMGLFDSTVYGFKKMAQVVMDKHYNKEGSQLAPYHEYAQSHHYVESFWEPLLIGLIAMAIGYLGYLV